jgi:putative effector of murein hydrolase LrgA (UPF0299 family)
MAKIFFWIMVSLAIILNLVGYIGQKVMEKRARKFSEERRK